MERLAGPDVDPSAPRGDQVAGEARFPDELDRRGLRRQKGVGAPFEDPPLAALRDDDAAEPRPRFEEGDPSPAFVKLPRRGQSGDPPADDEGPLHSEECGIWNEGIRNE